MNQPDSMAHPTPANAPGNPGQSPSRSLHTFPDPSLTLVEFGDALGILLAARTERDVANRRIVLSKVGYIRLESRGWGAAAYPEIHVFQDPGGIYRAVDARTGKTFRYPSRRRYEVAFLSPEIFQCAIQLVKEKHVAEIYELVAVNFGARPDFSVESKCLLAPEDYAAEHQNIPEPGWVDLPPKVS